VTFFPVATPLLRRADDRPPKRGAAYACPLLVAMLLIGLAGCATSASTPAPTTGRRSPVAFSDSGSALSSTVAIGGEEEEEEEEEEL
jgi:hypothetical protein